ncbi:MAG: hypothetical protein DRP15_02690 [Candidatus Aenigmatarchaeota archaeon]|nr:MAG: hypothetical protein DRP15_02690 [Candidatus Aenigmarchaeota archaeon]
MLFKGDRMNLSKVKYDLLKAAVDNAKNGEYSLAMICLNEAEDVSRKLGMPLAESVKKRIVDIYKNVGFFKEISELEKEFLETGNPVIVEEIIELCKDVGMYSDERIDKGYLNINGN